MAHTWTEHESCARCGTQIGEEYQSNHLGVRFCAGCYEDAVADRADAAPANLALDHVCTRCHGSLINGYHANYMGVLFCTRCFERTHTPEGRPRLEDREAEANAIIRSRTSDADDDFASQEEGEGVYLHDVFFVTTLLALVMYAVSKFGGAFLGITGP